MKPSRKPARSLLALALACAAVPAFAQQAPFSQTIFFGDSLTDSGHFQKTLVTIPSVGANGMLIGKFTTNPGLVWSEVLARDYGTNATTDNQGGTNYAVGGALVGTNTVNPQLGAVASLKSQATAYLGANGGHADPNALYSVWGGANDMFSITNPATAPAVIGGAVTAEVGVVGALKAAGAQYVLVANLPDLSLTPSARANGAAYQAQAKALGVAYNEALFGGLAGAGLSVIPVDAFHFLQEVAANPAAYGFSNVTTAGCLPIPGIGDSSLFCSPSSYRDPSVANSYLFADGIHPSTAAHAMIAQLAEAMIEGPRMVAMLPHVESTIGRARAGRVDARLATPGEGQGMRWWADVRGDSQRDGKGDNFDGQGPAVSVGVDWRSGAFTYGAFAGYGSTDMDWGLKRGSFSQDDASLGAYAGWRSGNFWANGQASYTWVGYDIDRVVRIGQATRVHSGSPDGSNLSLGASAGWNFGEGAFRHGPVVAVLSQQIDIDGYAESDAALSSALAFPKQSFDSLIGSAGWQFSWSPSERIHPYGRVTWDREFEDAPAQAFATAQSVPGSLQYAVPGVSFDDAYGTLLLGARTTLLGLDADFGTSMTFSQAGGNDATVFVSFGNRF